MSSSRSSAWPTLDDLPQAKELRPTPGAKPNPAQIADTESGDEADHATPAKGADTTVNEADEATTSGGQRGHGDHAGQRA